MVGLPAPPIKSLALLVLQRDLGMIILLNLVLLILMLLVMGRWGSLVAKIDAAVLAGLAGLQWFAPASPAACGLGYAGQASLRCVPHRNDYPWWMGIG